jgi:DNA-binding response OmpR family regulator
MRDAVVFGGSHRQESHYPCALWTSSAISTLHLARESGGAIPLTRGESALPSDFVAWPGRVISRDALLDAFAKRRFEPFDRSVDELEDCAARSIQKIRA